MVNLLRAIVVLGLVSALPAAAQDLQNFRPAPGVGGFLHTEGTHTVRPQALAPALWLHYGHRPLVARTPDGAVDEALIDHLMAADILLSYGIFEGFDLTLQVPIAGISGPGLDTRGNDGFATGDLRFNPRWRLYGDGHAGLGMAVGLPISLPTGDASRFLGGDGWVAAPKFAIDFHGSGLHLGSNLGVLLRSDATQVGNIDRGQDLTYSAALAVDLGTPMVQFITDWFGSVSLTEADASVAHPMEVLAAGRYHAPFGAQFTAGMGVGLIPDVGAADVRLLVGVAYEPPPEAERAPIDSDGDGLLDAGDQCPVDPEDPDGFEDTDGCPDPDNDGDGVLDGRDVCPNEPETINQFNDSDGCPDRGPARPADADGDGVLDREDRCPAQPEDFDHFQDRDGCPELDNDGDGILDADDKCPLAPENRDGVEDEDGCPEIRRVQVVGDQIQILEKVYFETSKASIQAKSLPLLDEVADVINAHPELKNFVVEGHTDKRGDSKRNLRLSQNRANEVRAYLIERGVSGGRLTAIGYGSTRPLMKGDSPEVWSKNRRVAFKIVRSQQRPAQVKTVRFTASKQAVTFTVALSRSLPSSGSQIKLEERGKMLVVLIDDAQASRAWVKGIDDARIKRALIQPGVVRPPSAELRIRLATPMRSQNLARRVRLSHKGAQLQVIINAE